jgi:catechol 2,3-dioxygenase-like lactoylglutathione lyase family enzyme
MDDLRTAPRVEQELGPTKFNAFAHVSVPCRDLEEGIAFYVDVLGGELRVSGKIFASVRLGGINLGFGSEGCSFMGPSAEYPHLAFYVGPDELAHMKRWLTQCGIPSSNFWTRRGVETLMFFRDPSGNVIELFCKKGFKGASELPRGTSRGHGLAIDINELKYDTWTRPTIRGNRTPVPD